MKIKNLIVTAVVALISYFQAFILYNKLFDIDGIYNRKKVLCLNYGHNKRKPYQMSVIFCIQDNKNLHFAVILFFFGISDSQSKGKRNSILLFM